MGSEILDIFGNKEDFLPKPNCKGFRNIIIKAFIYTIFIMIAIYQALLLKEMLMPQYNFFDSPIIYLSGTYFAYMIVSLLHSLTLFVFAGMLTNFNSMCCAKEVVVETAFFYKEKTVKYKFMLAIVITLAILPKILSYSLMPYFF